MISTAAVVGTGLIGTSVALALAAKGVRVHLLDLDESAARTAASLGAGTVGRPAAPVDIALLAVPPGSVGEVLAVQQSKGLAHSYMDVASVKSGPVGDVAALGDPASYIGGHPMAGRELSGPLAATAALFEGRSWVLTPTPDTTTQTLNRALEVIALCGAVPVVMDGEAHDRAVALVSHTPHVVAALMAARLQHMPDDATRLAGQGLRDVIRIAGGDPNLWGDILDANAAAVADVLAELADDLSVAVTALRGLATDSTDVRAEGMMHVADLLSRGCEGRKRIPTKHGAPLRGGALVRVLIGDQPGELASLLATVADLGINVEEVTIDHSPEDRSGLVELLVDTGSTVRMEQRLIEYGWRVQQGSAPAPQGRPAPAGRLLAEAAPAATA
ncbi:prephenate dehydrogenase [Streptomyces globisporus]|uniref:Prephenate dehydrogenase n=1 Tax=Streptomyces globisporus TaxID=1908 RepID=A0ABN8UXF5_STRGL|nr:MULTISPECIES: prephenate dehydrogenase [Streptomyces]PPA40719.1 prephenate dehydrogenase [Streptomyces griseus]RDL09492.1 prephenate dehydrogenase [Streptomyces sp. HB202]UIZ14620.1 prephenate dehydrogenase [Streptomyces sp. R527F]WSF77288.1 prephenate dehydrogenase [Streptomyces globisporus]WSQ92412.1 prephenate dehydrogenase [Streptomyces globisporus]